MPDQGKGQWQLQQLCGAEQHATDVCTQWQACKQLVLERSWSWPWVHCQTQLHRQASKHAADRHTVGRETDMLAAPEGKSAYILSAMT